MDQQSTKTIIRLIRGQNDYLTEEIRVVIEQHDGLQEKGFFNKRQKKKKQN